MPLKIRVSGKINNFQINGKYCMIIILWDTTTGYNVIYYTLCSMSFNLWLGCAFEMEILLVIFALCMFLHVIASHIHMLYIIYIYRFYINDYYLGLIFVQCLHVCVIFLRIMRHFFYVLSVQWLLRPLPVLPVLRCLWLVSRVPPYLAGTPHR